MEFLTGRCYTALNADELKPGSKVICANTLDSLRRKVNEEYDATELKEILEEDNERRFRTKFTEFAGLWPLAYLVSEPEEKDWIVYLCRYEGVDPYLTACRNDKWEQAREKYGAKTKLFEGTYKECSEWYISRRHFADVIAAWEDGKTIQYEYDGHWLEVSNPEWKIGSTYRIKPEPLKWTDLKIGDVIQNESHTHSMMVIGIDYRKESKCHILIGEVWLDDDDLNYWEKV